MSVEENKALVRHFYNEFINKGSKTAETALNEFTAPDFISHNPYLLSHNISFRSAFPDIHITIEDLVAEEDKVVARFILRGSHKGEFMGVAPTNKQVAMEGIVIFRIIDGKIAERWELTDMLGMMQQLDIIPSPLHPG